MRPARAPDRSGADQPGDPDLGLVFGFARAPARGLGAALGEEGLIDAGLIDAGLIDAGLATVVFGLAARLALGLGVTGRFAGVAGRL